MSLKVRSCFLSIVWPTPTNLESMLLSRCYLPLPPAALEPATWWSLPAVTFRKPLISAAHLPLPPADLWPACHLAAAT